MKGELTAVVLALVLSLRGTATAQQAAIVSGTSSIQSARP
jgi:hypothetical protein